MKWHGFTETVQSKMLWNACRKILNWIFSCFFKVAASDLEPRKDGRLVLEDKYVVCSDLNMSGVTYVTGWTIK